MKRFAPVILVVILVIFSFGVGFFIHALFFDCEIQTDPTSSSPVTLDSKKESTHLSKALDTEGVYWQRMFELFWNEVEGEKGELDWSSIDEHVKELNKMEIYPLAMVKPFANWDQDACHGEEYEASYDPQKGGTVKVGKPCDMGAFKEFLAKAVERYDGDGKEDMPGLEIPVKYWEIMNEPSMQGGTEGGMGEDLKFFVGTSQEYLDILKASYEVIKQADPEAKVVQGGQAGMHDNFVDFWTPVFEGGGANYFDIANIHAISVNESNESLYIIRFKEFLEKYDAEDKPIWVTEVQFGSLMNEPNDLKKFETLMVRASVFSLVQGADKLFYIENWTHWDDEGGDMKKKFNSEEFADNSTHKVYLNLVDKINEFDEVVIIKEEYDESERDNEGATSQVGQYKFVNGDRIVYVLWGDESVPSEISGEVLVTDIYGESENINASDLELSDVPVFVENI
ncbi:hypothetical protein ACFLY9_01620 [Patescibacteria group bacterium]